MIPDPSRLGLRWINREAGGEDGLRASPAGPRLVDRGQIAPGAGDRLGGMKHDLGFPVAVCLLCAMLRMAERPAGIVVLVRGSVVMRHVALNRLVAARLVRAGFGALLVVL